MAVTELIDLLKKLPLNNEIYANVFGEEIVGDIVGVSGYTNTGVSTVFVDRFRQLLRNLQKIADERNKWNIGEDGNE